jgi:hypothetical protein
MAWPSSIASTVLSFMNRPADVNNANFCTESNGCVGGFWKQLHGVAIYDTLVFLSPELINECRKSFYFAANYLRFREIFS